MARRIKRLPFRIPFFRIFYSTTYTALFLLCLILLAITPATIMWRCFRSNAYQYIIMIGGVYVLTAIVVLFIYSSRLYTNRTTLAAVGKAYIPVEEDEIGRSVRRMIEKQLQRSAVIAWEAKPRDTAADISTENRAVSQSMSEEKQPETENVGTIVNFNPKHPPWGRVSHDGWSSPSVSSHNQAPHICYASVIEELPNLLEAQAVSLVPFMAPMEADGEAIADPAVLGLLTRPETMDMSTYITQLSYLGLVRPIEAGQAFLRKYQQGRFSGRPPSDQGFDEIMRLFTQLVGGMTYLDPDIIREIRTQTGLSRSESSSMHGERYKAVSRASTPSIRSLSPVTARTRLSRNTTPYYTHNSQSEQSFASVMHYGSNRSYTPAHSIDSHQDAASISSGFTAPSEVGSVIWRRERDPVA